MTVLKRRVVADVVRQTGPHDEPHIFGEPAGDPGLTGPGSMSWEINGDIASVLIAGIGSIVIEIPPPSVMAGGHDLSRYLEQPGRRGGTALGYVVTTTLRGPAAGPPLIKVA